MYKIAKQSYESLHNLNPCLLLPNRSFQINFAKVKSDSHIEDRKQEERKKNVCNIIYSNQAFSKDSVHEIKSSEMKTCGLQTTPLQTEGTYAEAVMKRKGRPRKVKRLNGGLKSSEEIVASSSSMQRKNKAIKRMTRSGRVYANIE